MRNTKQIRFDRDVEFFTGEDRFLVPGQKLRVGLSAFAGVWEYEDYSVAYVDVVTGAVVVRRSGRNSIAVLTRECMLNRETVSVEYYGMGVDGQMVFPGDTIFVETTTGVFEAEFICDEGRVDVVRVLNREDNEVGMVPYDSVMVNNPQCQSGFVEIGEWVLLDGVPYIVAMVDCDSWALISIKNGNRFFDAEGSGVQGKGPGKWAVSKARIIEQADSASVDLQFCGKVDIINCEDSDE